MHLRKTNRMRKILFILAILIGCTLAPKAQSITQGSVVAISQIGSTGNGIKFCSFVGKISKKAIIKQEKIAPKIEASLYPNPFVNEIYIKMPFVEQDKISIKIVDIMGRSYFADFQVFDDETESEIIINASKLPQNQYIISVENNSKPYISLKAKK